MTEQPTSDHFKDAATSNSDKSRATGPVDPLSLSFGMGPVGKPEVQNALSYWKSVILHPFAK